MKEIWVCSWSRVKIEDLRKRVRPKAEEEGHGQRVQRAGPQQTRTFHTQTGSLLLPSEIKKAQKFEDPGMVLIGFKRWRSSSVTITSDPPPSSPRGGGQRHACLFSALLTKCSERNVFAVCRCISRRNYPPRFVALVRRTRSWTGQGSDHSSRFQRDLSAVR
ncbi:hypothetical protein KUCAC02_019222 [Chaenocephalus aceratus]|nr:hypothetical protein KUCAC02_019222 [Chaenocephalus aceratus]